MRKVLIGRDMVGDMDSMIDKLDLDQLAEAIRCVHKEPLVQAHRAVNIGLTLRNWLIGRFLTVITVSLNGTKICT
jgi:hypothetical protein